MSHLHYHQLDNGIHQLMFQRNDMLAVDEWMAWQIKLVERTPIDQTVRLLCYLPGFLPVNYVMKRSQAFIAAYPQRPIFRSAFVHPKDSLASLVVAVTNLGTSRLRDKVKFFPRDQEAQAIEWLLDQVVRS